MNLLRQYPKKLLWRLYFVSLGISLILDLLWLYSDTLHYHFRFQYLPEFFALFGLFGCMLLILVAKGMGYFIVKDEDYYEKRSR
ncbi:MAG: hypothetical protein ACUVWO_10715 [Thermodesulfobacteriota bacterium]